jgi:hypothetical protein
MKDIYARETKGYTKHPTLMDTEPTITKIDLALRIRAERERQFNKSRPNPGSRRTTEYLDSVKEEIHIRSGATAYQCFEIGGLLVDVKDLLPHGRFERWIDENFQFSRRTALNYCRVYRVCLGQQELVEFFKPSILYHLCAPDFPKDLREVIFDNATGVYDLSQKELLEVAIKYNRGEIKVDSLEVQNLLKKQKDQKCYERLEILLRALRRVLEDHRGKFISVVGRNMANPLIDFDLDEDPRCGDTIDAMIGSWIVEIDVLERGLNPYNKRKNCGTANVTVFENHKITSAQREEGLRMMTKEAVEDTALARKKRTRGKRFTRRS